jgi:hypothetical protein
MNRLGTIWDDFKRWPHVVQRAVIAFALYLLWLFSAWIYSEGMNRTAELLGIASSVVS